MVQAGSPNPQMALSNLPSDHSVLCREVRLEFMHIVLKSHAHHNSMSNNMSPLTRRRKAIDGLSVVVLVVAVVIVMAFFGWFGLHL